MELFKIQNFIDGKFQDPVGQTWIDSMNPALGVVHAQVPDSDERDIDQAVASAASAFEDWKKTKASERSHILNNIADLLEKRLDEFALAESEDQGKSVWLAKSVDIPRALQNFRFFAGAILHATESATDLDGKAFNYSQRLPMGVAGLISPWNLPLYLLTWKIAPALAVGNTAVCKPSELTSVTAAKLGEVLIEAGLPKGVCNLVFGTGPKAGAALTAHPQVPLISFTGGTQTAQDIIRASAKTCKKLGLELGGKNPNIIFADANFDECLETTLRSSFINQGEVCLCGSRIFVENSLYDKFLTAFVAKVKKLKVGDPKEEDTNLGALVSAAHRDKVKSYIDLARELGGTIEVGGGVPELPEPFDRGYFLEPTVITGLEASCRVLQEEIFGPVVTVTPFKTEEEAIDLANGVAYGLSASVWSQDIGKAHRVARDLDAGTVWINTWMMRDLRVPFGGMKASGLGREGGEHSLDFYTELKNICTKYD